MCVVLWQVWRGGERCGKGVEDDLSLEASDV